MGIKNMIAKAGGKAADKVAKLSVLSQEQLEAVESHREKYLTEIPSMDDEAAEEMTSRLLAASSVEIFNEYLNHIQDMYIPVQRNVEYGVDFRTGHNIRFFEITKWVTDTKENSLEKLVNVYEVLSNEVCNIALIFNRTCKKTNVYLAVSNTSNADDNVDVENYKKRLLDAVKGNFPGAELDQKESVGIVPCLKNSIPYSIACASNIPGEKSEKFKSQTIEKLLDGIVPDSIEKEYTIVLLATPIDDVENRKIHLAELYSAIAPYSGWETNFTFTQSDSINSSATFGVNVGASAGMQQGQNRSKSTNHGETDSSSSMDADTISNTKTDTNGNTVSDTLGETSTNGISNSYGSSMANSASISDGYTEGKNFSKNILKSTINYIVGGEIGENVSDTVTDTIGQTSTETLNNTVTESLAKNISQSVANATSKSTSNTIGNSIAKTLGKAVSNTVSSTSGIYKGVNLGANVGANFARASNVTATVGKNEGITQHFINYTIKHLLENLEIQMKRYEQSTALGMWDFAAYVLSEDQNVANNVAYSYLALTQGENSYVSNASVNLWRGDLKDCDDTKEICSYIKELRHPIFALNPNLIEEVPISNVYPAVVTPTTSLSGKELAYSLNFPSKSITGLPVISCAGFGRDVIFYDSKDLLTNQISLGKIYHMNHTEDVEASISLNSLSSHVFITGSTGVGKSNTVYKLIEEVTKQDIKFMVIEPAKGEYKNIFGNQKDVSVYGTNPKLAELLRINPFSFESDVHIYEHMDRLIELFNVCWPMYAAMPAVLKHAVEKSYEDCGWNLTTSTNTYGETYYPTFSDVARNIKHIIDSSEYDTENKGAYKGSLLTRLQSLSNGINGLIFTTDEIPPRQLFDKNVIVDLSRVGSTETKSLIMGMLVLKLQEYRSSCAKRGNMPLKHITVLEEAHNILKRTSIEQSNESSNLAGKSVEMISNAIAEMRTYGEGFIIVDQAPGLVDMSAIRNTNTKIIMRLPDQGDRELVGKSANLDDEQIKELSKLSCGVAAIYQNNWIQPILCKIDKVDHEEEVFEYDWKTKKDDDITYENRFKVAEMLSKGYKIGQEISREYALNLLKSIQISDFNLISILKLMENPPGEPNMKVIAPIMNELFPDITKKIKKAYSSEENISEWTHEANNILMKYNIDDQVRRDIIQGSITYYLLYETNNKDSLEKWWSMKGGFQ